MCPGAEASDERKAALVSRKDGRSQAAERQIGNSKCKAKEASANPRCLATDSSKEVQGCKQPGHGESAGSLPGPCTRGHTGTHGDARWLLRGLCLTSGMAQGPPV